MLVTPTPKNLTKPKFLPKKEKVKMRIIHNLSFHLNDSVNSNIPHEYCAVENELNDVCCSIVASIRIVR